MPLVVLTYPGHFLLTVLTIQSYLKYHPTPNRVIIVVDDLSNKVWPSYIEDCHELYSKLIPGVEIRQTSSMPQAHKFVSGWIRQQIVKLYLDTIVDEVQWFFTDGDIVFLHDFDPTQTPYTLPVPSEDQNNYIKNLLGIPKGGIFVNDQQVCVSDPPFKIMDRQVLVELRKHIETIHNRSTDDIHLEYKNEKSTTVSEWELIDSFKQYVLGQELNLIRYAPHRLDNIPDNLTFFTHQFFTCYSSDSAFTRQFFQEHGVLVSDDIWQILSKISE